MPSWRIELLDKTRHDRISFSCGEPKLDQYLAQTARQAHDQDTGRTFVAIDPAEFGNTDGKRRILGYFTVAMSAIDIESLPEARRSHLPNPVPAALLAQLAVDQRNQRQGLGRYLLMNALGRIVTAANTVAAYAIVVDAISKNAENFYTKYGFHAITGSPTRLLLLMKAARQLPL